MSAAEARGGRGAVLPGVAAWGRLSRAAPGRGLTLGSLLGSGMLRMRRLCPYIGTLLWLCFDVSLPPPPVPAFLPEPILPPFISAPGAMSHPGSPVPAMSLCPCHRPYPI